MSYPVRELHTVVVGADVLQENKKKAVLFVG